MHHLHIVLGNGFWDIFLKKFAYSNFFCTFAPEFVFNASPWPCLSTQVAVEYRIILSGNCTFDHHIDSNKRFTGIIHYHPAHLRPDGQGASKQSYSNGEKTETLHTYQKI